SVVLPISAWWPEFKVPGWVADFAIVSAALTRVFQTTDLIVPRAERANAEALMTDDHWDEIRSREGRFWGPLHRLTERINVPVWHSIHLLQRGICYPVRHRVTERHRQIVEQFLIGAAGIILMWGFVRFA